MDKRPWKADSRAYAQNCFSALPPSFTCAPNTGRWSQRGGAQGWPIRSPGAKSFPTAAWLGGLGKILSLSEL